MLLVSIIIPNYNHAPFLRQRIDAVLTQTYQNFELIILDDCSTDNSRKVIETYRGHPKVSAIIYNHQNSGNTFRQWKKGIEETKGELIWIAESDDYCKETFLELMINTFKENPSIGICQCNSDWVDEHGYVIFSDTYFRGKSFFQGNSFTLSDMTFGNSIYNASAVVFKKEMLHIDYDFVTGFRYVGDWAFWIQILERADYYHLPLKLNFYRKHSLNQFSNAATKGLFYTEGITIYSWIRKKYKSNFWMFCRQDRNWAFIFAKTNYPLKIKLVFMFNSLQAQYLIPAYVMWFLFKSNVLKHPSFKKEYIK